MAYNETTIYFLKDKRKTARLTQAEFADRAGVALTVVRKIEQGKPNLNMETVNQVLKMFGHVLAPVSLREVDTLNKKGKKKTPETS